MYVFDDVENHKKVTFKEEIKKDKSGRQNTLKDVGIAEDSESEG